MISISFVALIKIVLNMVFAVLKISAFGTLTVLITPDYCGVAVATAGTIVTPSIAYERFPLL
jgi:hypothetical protein